MSTPWYRVELELFTGPLDLLLYLVRRDELEIVNLPIARITRQFQEFLEVLQVLDLDLVGDFVVMASTLVEIKSRNVLPVQQEKEEAPLPGALQGDPRSDLIQQLLEYKQFKDAAQALDVRAQQWQERYPRLSSDRPSSGKDPAADRIKEVELWDLVSALGRILKRKDVESNNTIRYDETPIQTYVEQMGPKIREAGELPFSSFFEAETIRSKIVGMFLAILELVRHHGFRCRQDDEFGEIVLLPPLPVPEDGSSEVTATEQLQPEEAQPEEASQADVPPTATQ